MINEEAKRLRLFVERWNLVIAEISKATKTHESAISRYMSGERKVPLKFVKVMHLKYGLNYIWFFHGIGTLKYKAVDKRNVLTDLTDIQAGIGAMMASQDEMRNVLNRLVRDFYAEKNKV